MAITDGFLTIRELQGSIELLFTYSLSFVLVWFLTYYGLGLSTMFKGSEGARKLIAAAITLASGLIVGDIMMSLSILGFL